jgi:hypothetical protein
MMTVPSWHAIAAIALAIGMFTAFARGRTRVEVISLTTIGLIALGMYFFPLPGAAPSAGLALAFGGFGHHALITICALMILGRGLVVTGALDPAARALGAVWRFNNQVGLLVTLVLAFAMSMIINDTPVLVLMLPILVQLARKGGMPASRTLIPVNSAILIGGMATTIGTSTNLLVVSIASDMGMQAIPVFHYTPIVLVAALVALPYIWLVMPRLLPDNSSQADPDVRRFNATLRPAADSPALGKTGEEIVAMLPAEVRLDAPVQGVLIEGMRLHVSGPEEALEEAARKLRATQAPGWLLPRLRRDAAATGEDLALIEMTIAPDSRLIGLTLATAGLAGVAVLGVHQARRLRHETRPATAQASLREGDVLLVQATLANAQGFAQRDGLLILEGGRE